MAVRRFSFVGLFRFGWFCRNDQLLPDLQLVRIIDVVRRHEIVEGNFEFLRDREGIVALRHDVGLGRVMFWRAVLRWFQAIGFPFFNRDGFRRWF